ncbi:hypothetical protein GCK72_021545 [Caenorhabditis remanei]|uniref:Uncharacterized protein n=1 Tax=Caenorhabditis remanei TaxID=31234 RepID=A0A6A5GKW7_CAERE|nr:hypothetical protein GCK72_021545 [Caenorhabditis remanei]KAF1754979.1 hypothetical protein GCK72_021545 [Caenorhabditis remanei]
MLNSTPPTCTIIYSDKGVTDRACQTSSTSYQNKTKAKNSTQERVPCSTKFCTNIIRPHNSPSHPKTRLKICQACLYFYRKNGCDRVLDQFPDRCSNCKRACTERTRKLSHPKTGRFVCRSCCEYYRRYGQDRTKFIPTRNNPMEINISQEFSPDPMSTFLADVSKIFPTIDSIEDAFDHSDFTDHSSNSPDGNDVSNSFTNPSFPEIEKTCSVPFCTADLSRYRRFFHPQTQLKTCPNCYDSQRYAIKKAQPKTVSFQNFEPDTNPSDLIDEPSKNHEKIESGSQEKRNSEICSVPFCTADLSRYQCNFYHTKTMLKVCRPCSQFYFKHKRDRTEAQLSDKCSECKIKTKRQYCLRTQLPLCSTCYHSQRRAIKKSQPYIVCAPGTNSPVLIDEPSKNHEKIGSGSPNQRPHGNLPTHPSEIRLEFSSLSEAIKYTWDTYCKPHLKHQQC